MSYSERSSYAPILALGLLYTSAEAIFKDSGEEALWLIAISEDISGAGIADVVWKVATPSRREQIFIVESMLKFEGRI